MTDERMSDEVFDALWDKTWKICGGMIVLHKAVSQIKKDHIRAREAEKKLLQDLNAGREWMRRAWYELNAIRARDGAPNGVCEEWWDELTNALDELLGEDSKPWMLGAAKKMMQKLEAENAELRKQNIALKAEKAFDNMSDRAYNQGFEDGYKAGGEFK